MLAFYRNADPMAKEIETASARQMVPPGACCLLSSESIMLEVHDGCLEFVGPPAVCDVRGYSQLLAKREELHQWLVSPVRKQLKTDDVRQAISDRIEALVRVGVQKCGLSEHRARDLVSSLSRV